MFHTFDICEQVAERINNPNPLLEQTEEKFSLSLAHGWPGFALFYSTLHNFFPDAKYDVRAHTYLEHSVSHLMSNPYLPISLLQGVTGVCFAAHVCSLDGRRYPKLSTTLDQIFLEKIDEHFRFMETTSSSSTYSVSHGISGALTYLLLKQNDPLFANYTHKCLVKLVELMNRKTSVMGHTMPGWYEPKESLWHPKEKDHFANGKLTVGMLIGVSGVLAPLSIAACSGICVEGLHETILLLANWLKGKCKHTVRGPVWPKMISFEAEIGAIEEDNLPLQHSWEDETPFVIRSLYLASKALQDDSLRDFAIDAFSKLIAVQNQEFKGYSFIMGKAGLLTTAYRMSQDTQCPAFFKTVNALECDLKNAFHPSHPFGFETVGKKKGAGILEGAAGIALALLLVQGREDNQWDRMFFLR